jgi:DNA-directed RNA polymerase I and III subunit RPAC1
MSSHKKLADNLENLRNRVDVHPTHLSNTVEIEDPDAFRNVDYDNAFTLDDFKKNFKINFLQNSTDTLIFEMIGISAPIANALRRIFISDVETMAIDNILLIQNTSIIQDEVLVHRLGLVPIQADPNLFQSWTQGESMNEDNATVFILDVECRENPNSKPTDPPHIRYTNAIVYSDQLIWVPQGNQAEKFKHAPIRPVYNDIPLLKLRPGQSVQAELHVTKGTGRVHAKWSPVATAYYRQKPAVTFVEEFFEQDADNLVQCCPMNVFEIEKVLDKSTKKLVNKAVVNDILNCTMCRECIRDPEQEPKIRLQRVRDHYIFTIEAVGQLSPAEIFRRGIQQLKSKLGVLYHSTKAVQQDL